ncbi:MAG: extracellular solute-binding protein [Tissierellia bacterium]|nr:extracellular solute-binding protein [Tissierellia bacterium]
MILAIVGCSQQDKGVEEPIDVEEEVAKEPTEEEAVEEEAVAEEASEKLEDKLLIYSTHSEDLISMVADEFEKETGVTVEFINLKGELAERVEAEKNNPQADVMFGGASNLFMDLKEKDLFESFEPEWVDKLDPLFKDSENFWFGTIKTPVALFYNTEVVDVEDLPKDWSDLADEKYEGELIFRNALSSSARVMYSALLQQYEKNSTLDEGWEFMKGLDKNTKQYFDSGSLMMQSIGRKEASISFSTLNDVLDNKLNNDLPIEIVNLGSGYPVITDAIAVIKNSPHPVAAKAFVEFAGSAKIQSMLANEFNRMPTHPDAYADSPEWMAEVTFNVMDVDWANLAAKQSEWMQKWDTQIKDAGKDVE